MVSLENMQMINIMQTVQVILRNLYAYTYKYMHELWIIMSDSSRKFYTKIIH